MAAELPEGFVLDEPSDKTPAEAISADRFEQPGDMQPASPSALPPGFTLDPVSDSYGDAMTTIGEYGSAVTPLLGLGAEAAKSNIGRGIGERALQIVGGFAGGTAQIAEHAGDWLNENVGRPVWDEQGIRWERATPEQDKGPSSWITQKLMEIREGLSNPDLSYDLGTSWEDVKKAPLSNFLPFAVEQGLISVPDMAAVLTNWPGYLVSQEGEISYNRAANQGKAEPTVNDLLAAAPGAVLNTLMEKFGVEKALGLGDAAVTSIKQGLKELGKTALVEGGTEVAQQAGQYGSETIGTGKFNWRELAEQALQAGLVGAVFGPLVRAPLVGAELATAPREDKTQADQTQPEGVPEVPDTAGTTTPGAATASTPAPPAGAAPQHTEEAPPPAVPGPAAAPPAGNVNVVQPGQVAPDLEAATSPEPAAAPAPAPTPIPQAAPAAAPAPEEGITEGEPDTEQLTPEEQAQRDLQLQSLAELNAQPVEQPAVPPKAKRARKKTEALTPDIVPVQQGAVVTAPPVAASAPAAASTVSPEPIAAAGPVAPVPPEPAPTLAEQQDEGDDAIAALNALSQPAPQPVLQPAPAEAPAQPALVEQPAPATPAPVEARTAAPAAEAPVAQPVAPRPQAPAPAAPAPKNRQVAALMTDAVREHFAKAQDTITEHPTFEEAVQAAARRFAENLPKGTAPAAAVRESAPGVAHQVREHVAQADVAEAEKQAAAAVAEKKRGDEAQALAKKLDKERREGKGTPQEKARAGKNKKKTADELAAEDEKAIRRAAEKNAALPEDKQDPNLKEWLRLQKLRLGAKKDVKAVLTRQMGKAQEARVAARRAEETAARPAPEPKPAVVEEAPAPAPKPAEPPPAEPQAQPAKLKRQEGKKVEAAEKAIAETPEPDWSKIQTIPRLTAKAREYVNALISKAGLGADEVPNLQKHPLGKNLLLWARQQLRKGNVEDVPMAMMLYKIGDYDGVRGVIGSQILGGGGYTDIETGTLEEAEPNVVEHNVADESIYDFSRETKQGNWFNAKTGKHEQFSYQRRQTGSQALTEAVTRSPAVSRLAAIVEAMNIRLLKQLVGDVPVYWISNAEMERMQPGQKILGLYTNYDATDRAVGVKPSVILNADKLYGKPQWEQRKVIIHEMTHAATSFALKTNLRGTRDIVERMMKGVQASASPTDLQTFEDAFKNPREFVAEAFSNAAFQELLASLEMPVRVQALLTGRIPAVGGKALTWWNGFVAAVRNAIGLSPGGVTQSYLEGVVSIYPQTLLSSEAQEEHALTTARSQLVSRTGGVPDSILDFKLINGAVRNQLESALASPLGWLKGGGRATRMKLGTTEELSRRADQRNLFDGSFKDSAYTRYNDAIVSGRNALNQLFKNGPTGNPAEGPEKLLLDLARMNRLAPNEVNDLANVLYDSTVGRVDPTSAIGTGRNKHISKAGFTDEHVRTEHAQQQAAWNRLTPRSQAVGKRIIKIYDDFLNTSNRKTLRNIVDLNVNAHGLKLPAGETTQSVVDWVMSGDIDRPAPADPKNPQPGDRTARDSALHTALGETGKTLASVTALRKNKGVYVPLMREGSKFFMATRPVKPPSGAVVDKSAKHGNVLIFKDKKKLQAFQRNPGDEQIDSVVSRYIDPATGKRLHSKDVRAQRFFFATVQNRTMEMDDNQGRLERLRQQYIDSGHKATDILEADQHLFRDSAIMPVQITRLINNIERAGGGSTAQRATVGAVIAAYTRQLSGNRAAHHRLKRRSLKGFNRELLPNMQRSMRTLTGHLGNLDQGPKIAELEKALAKEIQTKAENNYGKTGDSLERQALFAESKRRQLASLDGSTRFDWQPANDAVRTATELSYLKHLATPMFTLMQILQPHATTIPQLAARYGITPTLGAYGKYLWRLGGASMLGRGVVEAGKELGTGVKRLTPYGSGPRDEFDYNARTRKLIAGLPEANEMSQLLDDLEAHGLGAGGGIEAPELSEIGRTRGGIMLNQIMRMARAMPEAAEVLNRHLTGMMAYELARRNGKSAADARREAVSWVEATQGGYAAENNPRFLSNRYLKAPLQFKKYPLMYGQAWWGNAIRALAPGTDKAVRMEAMRTVAYMSVMGTLLAGTAGLPIMELVRGILLAAWGDTEWEAKENWMQQLYSEVIGKTAGEALSRGVSRLAGIDLSSRLGNDSLVLFGDPRSAKDADVKKWLFDLMMGAPGGMVGDTLASWYTGDYTGIIPVPKIFSDVSKAYSGMQQGTTTKTGKQVSKPWSLPKAAAQAFGVRPASEARRWETGGQATEAAAKKQLSADRTDLMGRWYNAPDRGAFWRTEIRDWNRTHKGAEKIEYGDLARSKRRRDEEKHKTLEGAE